MYPPGSSNSYSLKTWSINIVRSFLYCAKKCALRQLLNKIAIFVFKRIIGGYSASQKLSKETK